jgi:hypothetical protein
MWPFIRLCICSITTLIWLLTVVVSPAQTDSPEKRSLAKTVPTPEQGRKTIDRGLAFLHADAVKWRKERKCATCHHGTMTLWAMSEARNQGYSIADETLAEVSKWTKERLANIDKPRDKRPGWNMVNTPAVYLALMALAVPTQDAISPAELERIAGHLIRHQETNGSWAWSLAPAQNRPPPVFESDEVVTLMAYMTLAHCVTAATGGKQPASDAPEHAAAWLKQHPADGSTQATALRLFRDVQGGKPRREIEKGIDQLLSLQHEDGGWGQEKTLSSDAYATGQALYFLNLSAAAKRQKGRADQRQLEFPSNDN